MNKTDLVYLFPGQGAQYQGMALDFLDSKSPAVKKLFDQASAIFKTGAYRFDSAESLLRDSDANSLKRTDLSQPALTLANLAAAAFLSEQGYEPKACAGFSLGEYAALACAGVISVEDCLRLVTVRGMAMQRSVDCLREAAGGNPESAPGMAAVTGLAPEQAEAIMVQWGAEGVYAANFNSPRQLVISGTARALAEAEHRFKESGAKRVIRLQVAGPFHSPLVADAASAFSPFLESVTFNDPEIPLYSNVTGKRIASGAEAKALALLHITSPVRWLAVQEVIAADIRCYGGTAACLEVGPGKVLQGLWKDSVSGIPCYAAGTVEDIRLIAL